MMLWIEGAVALVIAAAFVTMSFFMFKPDQVAHGPLRVRIGAGLQGLIIGLVIGFVILPLRISYGLGGAAAPSGLASLTIAPALVLLILIRRGALLRVPLVSPFLRAYRRALLLRTRDDAVKNLVALDAIEARATS